MLGWAQAHSRRENDGVHLHLLPPTYGVLSRHHTTDSRLSMAPCYSPPAAHQKSIARVACWSSSDEPLKQAGRQGQPPTLHASASPRVAFIPAVLARRTKLLCRGPWADPARPLPPLFSISIFFSVSARPPRCAVQQNGKRTATGGFVWTRRRAAKA